MGWDKGQEFVNEIIGDHGKSSLWNGRYGSQNRVSWSVNER